MQFRFDEGLQYSTIKGDVAAIAAYHRRFQRARRSLGRDTAIKAFLRGVFRLRPPVKEIVPKWELSLVLQALNEAPFEPAKECVFASLDNENCVFIGHYICRPSR